jgi:hypothetical protein
MAFLIANNRLTENSSWDERMLGEQLKILSELELDFDLETIGFEVPEIDLLIDGLNAVPEADPDDRLPDVSESAITASGDLWRRCYGLELDPLYVDTIIRRWQRQTKLDAVHVETGETFNSRDNTRGQ